MKPFNEPLQMRLLIPAQLVTRFALSTLLTTIICSGLIVDSYAQESSDAQVSTLSSTDEIGGQLSEIKNMTTTEMAVLSEISLTSTKLATQGAYTAMSVFFLGISLVIFGLRMTTRSLGHMGKYFIVMIWALTLPVVTLVGLYQIGVLSGGTLALPESDEPFFLLSFLMYIPIGIVLFLLLAERRLVHSKTVPESSPKEEGVVLGLERLSNLKEKGMITDDEFRDLKTQLFAKLASNFEKPTRFEDRLKGSEPNA